MLLQLLLLNELNESSSKVTDASHKYSSLAAVKTVKCVNHIFY